LVFDEEGFFLRFLGAVQKNHFWVGNLVARQPNHSSEKKIQPSTVSTTEKDSSLFVSLPDIGEEQLGGSKEETCELYVTKLQKEIGVMCRVDLFHEYVWSDTET
jgi:hypothetical protein